MVDELDEVKEGLVDITKLLSRSSGEAFKFKQQLLGMNDFVEGKNYQIVSRFLSGTGAWKVLNKAKASVLTLMQIMNASERAAERDAKRFERMAKATKEMTELKKLNSALDSKNIEEIKKAMPYYEEMAKVYGGEDSLLSKLKEQTERQIGIQEGLIGGKRKPMFKFETLAQLRQEKRHRELLGNNKNNALLVTAGLGLNLKQLVSIAKSSNATAAHQAAVLDWETKTAEKREELGGMTDLVKMPATLNDFTRMYSTERFKEVAKYSSDEIEKMLAEEFGPKPEASKKELSKLDKMLGYLAETSKMYKISGMLKQGKVKLERLAFKNISELSLDDWKENSLQGIKDAKNFAFSGKRWRKRYTKFLKFSEKVGKLTMSFLNKFMYYFTIIVLGLFVLKRAFTLLQPFLSDAFESLMFTIQAGLLVMGFALDGIREGLGMIWDGINNGNILKVLVGLLAVIGSVAIFIFGVLLSTVGALFGALIGAIIKTAQKAREDTQHVIDVLGGLAYVVGATMVLVGLFATAVVSLPLVLGGIVVAGIAAIFDTLGFFANGGVTGSGLSIVGERGPELVRLPTGTRVHSNRESKQMLSNAGGNTIHVHVNGRVGASDAEIRDIANKVAKEINIRMNRTSSTVSML